MPAPPARIRSASVPCGTNSTSSSPARYCRSNSPFSPTYDDTILRICFVCRRRPRPQSSTPALLETQVRSFTPRLTSALIRFSGMPQRPKPPTTSVAPSATSRTASSADATTLLIMVGRYQTTVAELLGCSVAEWLRVKALDLTEQPSNSATEQPCSATLSP